MQSLIRNCVNDYWGRVEIGSCLPTGASARLENIHTRLGVSVSGVIENEKFSGIITALRNCQIEVNGERIDLTRGEKKEIK